MTRTAKKTGTTTDKRALPRAAAATLTSLEENVLRMRAGITVPDGLALASNAFNDELAEKLHAIEARAFEMTGRAQASRAKRPSPKDKIVASLKAKA
ncbi:MAG: hypothetical protein JXR83_11415 [Deltaproteobacteria bacterium]|nr:hypothetical protein [Deltaproteobacteria bacterium]